MGIIVFIIAKMFFHTYLFYIQTIFNYPSFYFPGLPPIEVNLPVTGAPESFPY